MSFIQNLTNAQLISIIIGLILILIYELNERQIKRWFKRLISKKYKEDKEVDVLSTDNNMNIITRIQNKLKNVDSDVVMKDILICEINTQLKTFKKSISDSKNNMDNILDHVKNIIRLYNYLHTNIADDSTNVYETCTHHLYTQFNIIIYDLINRYYAYDEVLENIIHLVYMCLMTKNIKMLISNDFFYNNRELKCPNCHGLNTLCTILYIAGYSKSINMLYTHNMDTPKYDIRVFKYAHLFRRPTATTLINMMFDRYANDDYKLHYSVKNNSARYHNKLSLLISQDAPEQVIDDICRTISDFIGWDKYYETVLSHTTNVDSKVLAPDLPYSQKMDTYMIYILLYIAIEGDTYYLLDEEHVMYKLLQKHINSLMGRLKAENSFDDYHNLKVSYNFSQCVYKNIPLIPLMFADVFCRDDYDSSKRESIMYKFISEYLACFEINPKYFIIKGLHLPSPPYGLDKEEQRFISVLEIYNSFSGRPLSDFIFSDKLKMLIPEKRDLVAYTKFISEIKSQINITGMSC